jgi:hypothetical protein
MKDYDAAHRVQDGYKISLLADWGKTPRRVEQKIDPSVDTKTEPLRLVNEMPAVEYFTYGAELMKKNKPHLTDWSIIERMRRIGFEPGKGFNATTVSADTLAKGAVAGLNLMRDKGPTLARVTNGWQIILLDAFWTVSGHCPQGLPYWTWSKGGRKSGIGFASGTNGSARRVSLS